jgi:hypothetical protein
MLDGRDVGRAYRLACVDSWGRLGDRIVSVNNNQETAAVTVAHDRVAVCAVQSNGMSVAGRPLVLFNDLLRCAVDENADLIALTNSDIFFADAEALRQQAATLKSGEAIVARRVNVQSVSSGSGSTYQWGYDLFILHREDIRRLYREETLFFGEPWWDYYFLSNIIVNGITVRPIDSAHVLHLAHKEAYSPERWLATGCFSLQTLRDNITAGRHADDEAARYFIDTAVQPAALLPLRDTVRLAVRNIRALTLHYAALFFKVYYTIRHVQETHIKANELHLFSCALTIHAEITVNFGISSAERIKAACVELQQQISSSS